MGGTSYGTFSGAGGGGGGGGVTSLNSETGDVVIVAGTNVTVTPSGQNITIASSPGTTGNLTDAGTDGIIITGGTGSVLGSGTSIAQHVADASHNGYLSSADWSTFNSKGSGTVTAVSVASANGLAGTSSGGATPALTLTTSINAPALAGNGTAISAATTTGSGSTVVLASAPTLTSPVVGTQTQGDASTKAASTAYVDTAVANAIAGVNPAVAVQAATTAASDTSGLTYNNGASGIGATFTGAVNTALTVDGYTFTAINQRLLVKNDTQSPSGAFNGVYYVTQIQTAILPIILTRALDYDMPSDMNNTGAIPVINGTVNGTTSWVLTSQVVTVGTTPLTFAKFSINPSTIVTAVSVASANGFAGSSSGGTTPALTVSTSITGIIQGNGTALSAITVGSGLSFSGGTLSATGGGATAMAILTKTANYTIVTGDFSSFRLMVEMNATSATTLTLPAASNSGYELNVINIGSATVTIATAGSDTFGSTSDTTWTLIPGGSPQSSNTFISNGGTRWAGF